MSDPEVLAGTKEATIELDFSKLEESDASGETRFVVGGRAYFEANLFGFHVSSFTTKGFFDKEGYEEPKANNLSNRAAVWWASISTTLILLVILVIVVLYYCRKQSQEQSSKSASTRGEGHAIYSKVHYD